MFRSTLTTVLSAAALATAAAAEAPSWDDQVVGDTFFIGMSTVSDGVFVGFDCFEWTPPAGSTCNGHAVVDDRNLACGFNYDLNLNNINAVMDFAGTIGAQTDLRVLYGEYGGNINLSINGDFANAEDFLDLDGAPLGGTIVHVYPNAPGDPCGVLLFEGVTEKLAIGGQELWIDARITNEPDDCTYGFEEFAPGDLWLAGDTFMTSESVPVQIHDFLLPGGGSTSGYAEIGTAGLACDTGNELWTNNVRARFLYDTALGGPGSHSYVDFKFGEYGGEINFAVNTELYIVDDFIDLDGLVIGGCTISIPSGGYGNDCGLCVITGTVEVLEIGGQELWIDCFNYDGEDPPGGGGDDGECEHAFVNYDDLTDGAGYWNGDTFATVGVAGSVDVTIVPYEFLDGTMSTTGSATIQTVGLSCGDGLELQTYAIAAVHRFASTIGSLVNVSVKVADHGGPINYGVNGLRVAANTFADIDGLVLGGCTLHVVSGGGVNECTELYIEGTVDGLLLGGGQFMIDCIEAQDIISGGPLGDLNGDGVVDGGDLGLLLAAWGTAGGDLNGDGTTDGADLGLLLANWI
jgi:hypothetical protein